MKRILILCLTIVIFLTGCDISAWLESETPSTETPSTEMPSTETPSTEAPNTETPGTEIPGIVLPSIGTPSTETPKTELDEIRELYPDLPMSETVTLGDLIKREDVVYIDHYINNSSSPSFAHAISYDIDKLFSILIDPNSDKIFITDTQGVEGIYDIKWNEARDDQFSADDYVAWSFWGENGEIGYLTVSTSGFMQYYNPTTKDVYFCLGYSNVSVDELRELLYKGDWYK